MQGAGYTVSGVGNDAGGNVTFATAPASAVKVTRLRKLPLTQLTDLPTQGPLNTTSLENQLDRLVMLSQQVQEQIDRALLLVVESTLTGLTLTPEASKYLQWNASANGMTNVASVTPGTTTVTAFMETLLDDLTAAAARTTLDVPETAQVTNLSGRRMNANGDMRISQRGEGVAIATGVAFTTSKYGPDRNKVNGAGTPQLRAEVEHVATGGPAGFPNFMRVDITTAETAVAAGEAAFIEHAMEGQDLQQLEYGGATARTIVVKFRMRSPKTGTHCVASGRRALVGVCLGG